MDIIFGTLGFSIQIIFMFKREWLFERRTFSVIYLISSILFISFYILNYSGITADYKTTKLLTVPLLASSIFYVIKLVFFMIHGRNLQDTFWSMDSSLMSDGFFNAIFWLLGGVLSMLFAYLILP